ncbi:hypothetical protein E4T42_00715 [Aureobasidium subglaciale]|nr:hypothetical protein E4T42_00715 [Aureobasidium subglaciale]
MFVGIRLASSLDRRAENVRAEGGQRKSIAESRMTNVVHVRAHQQQVCYELKDTEIFVSSHPQLPSCRDAQCFPKQGNVRGKSVVEPLSSLAAPDSKKHCASRQPCLALLQKMRLRRKGHRNRIRAFPLLSHNNGTVIWFATTEC